MTTIAPPAFVSYSREDSGFALKLAGDLKAGGANVWLDQLDIIPGERWDNAVENALNNCTRMVVILSPASVNSTNVMDEVSFALDEHKTVVPVIHRDCGVPFRLRRVQHVDFRPDYARGIHELLRTLGSGERGPVPPDVNIQSHTRTPDIGEHRVGPSRVVLPLIPRLIGAGAILSVVAVGCWLVSHFASRVPQAPGGGIAPNGRPTARSSGIQSAIRSAIATSDVQGPGAASVESTILPPPPYPPDPPPPVYPSDKFDEDGDLKTDLWATGTPLLGSVAGAQGFHLVPARLSFNQTGMTVSGVTGLYQFAGVQSQKTVSPPSLLPAFRCSWDRRAR